MRPFEQIQHLTAENENLRKLNAALNQRLTCAGLGELTEVPAWAAPLTAQEAAVMYALIECYPRTIDVYTLDEIVPHHDHAQDRNVHGLFRRVICLIRKALGTEAVETVRSIGYRASKEFMNSLVAK